MKKKVICGVLIGVLVIVLAIVAVKIFNNNNGQEKIAKAEEVFENFKNGLSELNIEFTEMSIDISGYDVLAARMYVANEHRVAIYYLDEDSDNYSTIEKNGYITNHDNSDLVVSGIVENGYLFYLEQDFPNGDAVYALFDDLTSK